MSVDIVEISKLSNSFTIEGYIAFVIKAFFYAGGFENIYRSGQSPRNITGKYAIVSNISTSNWGFIGVSEQQTARPSPSGQVPRRKIYVKNDRYSFNFYNFHGSEVQDLISWLYSEDAILMTGISFSPPTSGATDLSNFNQSGNITQIAFPRYNQTMECKYQLTYIDSSQEFAIMKGAEVELLTP